VEIPTKLKDSEEKLIISFSKSHDSDATHTAQASKPAPQNRKGFFNRLKDALS
jgi:molecular chaperone DnaJ